MNSSTLIARIARVVDTDGSAGSGADLASAYTEAVQAVNARMEKVIAALSSGQESEAVRLMEASPRLVDEVGTLDFFQYSVWQDLCSRKGWALSERPDQTLLEKILAQSSGASLVEPALKLYRKAMRSRDEEMLLVSLRRLAESDSSQDWKKELLQLETTRQKNLLGLFRKAVSDGNAEDAELYASRILDEKWANPVTPAISSEPLAFREKKEKIRRQVEQKEDLSILEECDKNWNLARALSLLAHLDHLVENGLPIPKESDSLVVRCRERSQKEVAAEEAAARRRDLQEQLHAAIEHEDANGIRMLLASPEFLENPPDEELRDRADQVLIHAEEARRRRIRLIMATAAVFIVVFSVLAGRSISRKHFNARCEAEAKRLQSVAQSPMGYADLEKALSVLEKENPSLYRDPRIRSFESILSELKTRREKRLSDIRDVISSLNHEKEENWPGSEQSTRDDIDAAKTLLHVEDKDLSEQISALTLEFERVMQDRRQNRREAADHEMSELLPLADALRERVSHEFPTEPLRKNISEFRDRIESWNRLYRDEMTEMATRLEFAVSEFDPAEKTMKDAGSALTRFQEARTLDEFLAARKVLPTFYGEYQGVRDMPALPVEEGLMQEILSGRLPAQLRFAPAEESTVSQSDFEEFLEGNVLVLKDIDSWFSLYAVGDGREWFVYSIGRPTVMKPIRDAKGYGFHGEISGTSLLSVKNKVMQDTYVVTQNREFRFMGPELSPISKELHEVVDFAEGMSITKESFIRELSKKFQAHLVKGHDPEYVKSESSEKSMLKDRFPAFARVILMNQYLEWMTALGETIVKTKEQRAVVDRLKTLASKITIDGVDSALSWACAGEERVLKRNRDCAVFLQNVPIDFLKTFRESRAFEAKRSSISEWRPKLVGRIDFLPTDTDKKSPILFETVQSRIPVYVLRGGNTPFLKKAFEIDENGKKLARSVKDWILGEPLFLVTDGSSPINPESAIGKLLESAPEGAEKEFSLDRFWIELPVKKGERK